MAALRFPASNDATVGAVFHHGVADGELTAVALVDAAKVHLLVETDEEIAIKMQNNTHKLKICVIRIKED